MMDGCREPSLRLTDRKEFCVEFEFVLMSGVTVLNEMHDMTNGAERESSAVVDA